MSHDDVELSESRLVADLKSTAEAIGSPFSEDVVRRVFAGYAQHLPNSAVILRTTDRPGDHLNYRLFARERIDTIDLALKAGLLTQRTQLTSLIDGWSGLYTTAEQSCEFDAIHGLTKTWIHLGELRPVDEILDNDFVPHAIRKYLPLFQQAGFLDYVRFVAVDHCRNSVNIYFRARGPLTPGKHALITGLAGASPASEATVSEIQEHVSIDFSVAFTISLANEKFERSCFYAIDVPTDTWPHLSDRLKTYLKTAPCYDAKPLVIAGWSSGHGGSYLKLEKAYWGNLASVLARWNAISSGSTRRDPVFALDSATA